MNGAHVLVVEDDFLIGLELASTIDRAGYVVVGPARTLDQALALAESSDIDAALLDWNLWGSSGAPVARTLKGRGVPFAIVSGYDKGVVEDEFQDAPFLAKPCLGNALLDVVARLTLL